MMVKVDFTSLWGRVLIKLKEDGKKALYAEAIEVKSGSITQEEVTAYIRIKESLLEQKENAALIKGILEHELLRNIKFTLIYRDEEKIKRDNLKKLFGDKLEIV